ncbi:MAG: nucleotide exchange factor GrpE [Candidatus Yanofskybacteria bacterium RIFCSPHIGHO2_02_FULL_44_12b]|uniref:Protein GrpE n=2 Tax=Candidatus Yanofskyibacteriota TaxID=1752733 RepID=A0A1F8GMN8_9BACT|nr:MAG: Protein GrpE [Candidatus Yanofskybacteria bacterium GW2011_GWA2_44_9]OGN04714.1 MAG: nucleotide exchange factor GrpE [Candidatus Yanofskybacteria bacterium RIFCSPHIGHO2_01_FULL_44_24]OGN15622.1 MAG: nucleotide exchange factor GrpE [Candidatus Yanofskybacteria bacterium RIFCSPHIGHO2_02_FULL_44_12b]OGN26677.1 MAG: nucleotide exchange factor GrpE [Candidatus Yanofskybacteria bacterium RIFCSPLOWO2_01_FULL_44_22]
MTEEQNKDVEAGVDELEKCKQRAEEYLNNWKRERADFINYKKDEAKRIEEFLKFSTEGLIVQLIDAIDGIEVARNNLPESEELKGWINGFDGALDKVAKFLNKFGVERIGVDGEKFDPLLHEAVEVADKDGDKIQEIRPGYTMHGKVIRPARVRIIK